MLPGVVAQHLADHRHTRIHMGVHHMPILIAEQATLQQYEIRNPDLANVVQSRKMSDLIHISATKCVS